MIHPLTLLRASRPADPVSAGWLASAEPVDWLQELAHARTHGCRLAMYVVASSLADPRPAGVLLVPKEGAPCFRPRVQPLQELLPGVHAPSDAILSHGLLSNEREFFFPYQVHFFHPSLGLVGFDAKDELPPAKLLSMPPQKEARWNLALPARRFDLELKSIVVAAPSDPEAMLADAADGIAEQPGKLPDDGKNPFIDKAGMIGKGLAGGAVLGAGAVFRALGRAYDSLSGSGAAGNATPPSRDKVREWAEKNWQMLTDKRSREVDRLLKLMESNPDEGLRYALPLAGGGESRGVAPPSWSLGARSTNFSLGRGGGPADHWDLGDDSRLKLEEQYREAAKRETLLGRHERAAYIYGNLLGDWGSAAKSLADAGRHHDAVSIYLHKLNNRPAAARCLETAGLLLQAAAMYAECRHFEKAGDLHAQLGNETAAREMWQAEVDAQSDPLAKARLLRKKLGEKAAALAILDAAWRKANRSEDVLSAIFTIHREEEDPDACLALLRELFSHPGTIPLLLARLNFGHEESRHWGLEKITRTYEEFAYRRIAMEMASNPRSRSELLAFLPKLAPDDLILARDARRYGVRASPPTVPKIGTSTGFLKAELVVQVSKDADWHSLSTLPKGVSLAGYGKDMLVIGQLRDNSCHTSAMRTSDDPGKSRVDHIAVSSERNSSRLFHFKEHHRLHYRALDRTRSKQDDDIGTIADVIAIGHHGEEGDFVLLQYTQTGSISAFIYSEAAELRQTVPLDMAPPGIASMDWKIAGHGPNLCIAVDRVVAFRPPAGDFVMMHLPHPVTGMRISPTGSQILVTTKGSVLVADVPKPGKLFEAVDLSGSTFGDPESSPVACFLPDGAMAIARPRGGEIFSPGRYTTPSARFPLAAEHGDPVAIAARGNGGFAILTNAGNLVVFGK